MQPATSQEIARFAAFATFALLMVSCHLAIGAVLHAALIGWTVDWSSLPSIVVLVAWPSLLPLACLAVVGAHRALSWFGKSRTR